MRLVKFFVALVMFLVTILSASAVGEVIDGDTVYINDSKLFMSATPHTSHGEDVVIDLKSKVFSGDVNLVFLYPSDTYRPSGISLWNPNTFTNPNGTVEVVGWQKANFNTQKFERELWGSNWTIRLAENLYVNEAFDYRAKVSFDYSAVSPDEEVEKYWICIYPSSYGYNVRTANQNDHLYCLDPWSGPPPTGGNAYYDMEEGSGTTLIDLWGDNNGSITGAIYSAAIPTFGTSGDGGSYSLSFDGSGDFVDVGSYGFDSSGELSVSLWGSSNSMSSSQMAFYYSDSSENVQFYSYWKSTGEIEFAMITGSNVFKSVSYDVDFTDWVNVVLTAKENDFMRLYVNGTEVNSTAITTFDWQNNDGIKRIGYSTFGYFNGYIDEVKIFNRSLNTTEISNLYNYGNISAPSAPVSSPFLITASSAVDGSLLEFSANITELFSSNTTTYSTTNGTIVTPYLLNSSQQMDIDVFSDDHFTTSYDDYRPDLNGSLAASLDKYPLVNAFSEWDNSVINNFTLFYLASYSTTTGNLYVPINDSNVNVSIGSSVYLNLSYNLNLSPNNNVSVLLNQSRITFDSFEKFTGDQLSGEYILLNGSGKGASYVEGNQNMHTTTNSVTAAYGARILITKGDIYISNVTVDSQEAGTTRARLYYDNNTLITSTTNRSGDTYFFDDDYLLEKDSYYRIAFDDLGGSYTLVYSPDSSDYEFNYFTMTDGVSDFGGPLATASNVYLLAFIGYKAGQVLSENESVNLIAGNGYEAIANVPDYYNKTITFNVAALDNKTVNVTGMYDTVLNITSVDSFDNTSIDNFTLTITSDIYNDTINVTNYELINTITNYLYTLTGISTGAYLLGSTTITPTTNQEQITIFLDPFNSVNITFKEHDGTTINDTTINITLITDDEANNYNTTDGTLQLTLLTPKDYELRTSAEGYNERKYYFTVTNQSTQNIIIYLETNVTTELQQFRILDTSNTEVTGATLRIEQQTTDGENLWTNYGEEVSNAEGIVNTQIEKGLSNYYRFAVFRNGTILTIYPSGSTYTSPTNFVSGVTEVVEIVVNTESFITTDYYEELYGVNTEIGIYNNNTVWYSWTDAQNSVAGAKLVITGKYVNSNTSYETIAEVTSTSTSGNLSYELTPINGSIYIGTGYIIYSDHEVITDTIIKSYNDDPDTDKNTGLLYAIVILAVTALLTIFLGVMMSSVITFLLLVFTNLLGFTNFPTTIITSLIALAIILFIKVNKGDGN